MKNLQYYFLVLMGALFFLSGCAGTMLQLKETFSKEQIEFEPLYIVKFDARDQTAEVTKKDEVALEKDNYVNFGSISVEHLKEICFPDEPCTTFTHSNTPISSLLSEARARGGDLVKLGLVSGYVTSEAVKNGRCLREEKVLVYDNNVCGQEVSYEGGKLRSYQSCKLKLVERTACVEYEKIYGKRLSAKSSGTVWRKDKSFKTLVDITDKLYTAAIKGQLARVKSYVQQGIPIDSPDVMGRYPLTYAVKANQTNVAIYFLEKGANPKVNYSRNLVRASEENNTQMVAALLKYGADPNAEIGFFSTISFFGVGAEDTPIRAEKGKPIINAVEHKNKEMLELLLEAGADGTVTSFGRTPLQQAMEVKDNELTRLLIWHKAGINARSSGMPPPLIIAVETANVDVVKMLVEAGADLNVTKHDIGTRALRSLFGNKSKTALALAKERASPQKNKSVELALAMSGIVIDDTSKENFREIVDVLTKAGAK